MAAEKFARAPQKQIRIFSRYALKFRALMRTRGLESTALLLLSVIASPALAQQATVSLSSASSVPGGTVSLSVSLASAGRSPTGRGSMDHGLFYFQRDQRERRYRIQFDSGRQEHHVLP